MWTFFIQSRGAKRVASSKLARTIHFGELDGGYGCLNVAWLKWFRICEFIFVNRSKKFAKQLSDSITFRGRISILEIQGTSWRLAEVRLLKNLCLTVSGELTDSLPAFVSYSAKLDATCVQSSRLIPCEVLVSWIEPTMDLFEKIVRREAPGTGVWNIPTVRGFQVIAYLARISRYFPES